MEDEAAARWARLRGLQTAAASSSEASSEEDASEPDALAEEPEDEVSLLGGYSYLALKRALACVPWHAWHTCWCSQSTAGQANVKGVSRAWCCAGGCRHLGRRRPCCQP